MKEKSSQIDERIRKLESAVSDMSKQLDTLSQNVSKHDGGKVQKVAGIELKQESLTNCSLPPTPGGDCSRSSLDSVHASSLSSQTPQDISSRNSSSQSLSTHHAIVMQPYTFPTTDMVR